MSTATNTTINNQPKEGTEKLPETKKEAKKTQPSIAQLLTDSNRASSPAKRCATLKRTHSAGHLGDIGAFFPQKAKKSNTEGFTVKIASPPPLLLNAYIILHCSIAERSPLLKI